MTLNYAVDHIVFGPDDVDLTKSPLRASLQSQGADTFVLGAFNPGLTRLPNGNLLIMVRVAEALREPVQSGFAHAVRWTEKGYRLDAYPVESLDLTDPRKFQLTTHFFKTMGLTSLSWLLPVELTADGTSVVRAHYEKAIAPTTEYQEYGLEDARISLIDGTYNMTACSVSAARHATSLYTSRDGLNYELRGLVLDHQNKDMLFFEGKIASKFWAMTRPLGDLYFVYPPDSPYHAGPSINLATSPDGLHWKPHEAPFIRPRKGSLVTTRIGGGAPPIRSEKGWLAVFHGVTQKDVVGIYRTFWALLDGDDPTKVLHLEDSAPVLEYRANLLSSIQDKIYLTDVVFTTGIARLDKVYVVASGEADLACRITHIPRAQFE